MRLIAVSGSRNKKGIQGDISSRQAIVFDTSIIIIESSTSSSTTSTFPSLHLHTHIPLQNR